MMIHIPKPAQGEFMAYAGEYIGLLPDDGLILPLLEKRLEEWKELIAPLPAERLHYRYAPGKWNIKEILVHLMDTERVFAYRTLRISRNDRTPLPGFDQDDYVLASGASERSITDILQEYEAVRQASLLLFRSLGKEDLVKQGIANGNPVSVRAMIYQVAGHELHHRNIIQQRYLQPDTVGST